ncbi:MAG: Gfo/Idh/MocA family oxidoreductase [Candidatus Altiarchaeota archaeon]|nr:Gfo/Idh/MocA family oxidoreductase [Candidatus Altiarchaeota archaeon]
MDRLRVGVIGVGSMGRHHARVYSENHSVEFVGVSDVDKAVAEAVATKCRARAFTDYRSLLDEGVDAVSIAVPTTFHREVALEAMGRGVHVLVEKPIADTIAAGREIISKAKEKGVVLMVGHIERFNPIIPVIKKSIEGQKVISISITRVGPLPPRVKDVGVVVDIGVHDIDIIRHLTGSEYKSIYPLVESNIAAKEDIAMLSFVMENGVLAHITTDWLTPYKVREISVSTKEKFIRGNFITQKVTEYSSWKDSSYIVKDLFVPFGEPLALEIRSFLNSVATGAPVQVTGEDSLKALEIALACLKPSKQK